MVAKDTGFGEIWSWPSVQMHHNMPVYLGELDYKLPVASFLGLEVQSYPLERDGVFWLLPQDNANA